jgi:hypothetical protein
MSAQGYWLKDGTVLVLHNVPRAHPMLAWTEETEVGAKPRPVPPRPVASRAILSNLGKTAARVAMLEYRRVRKLPGARQWLKDLATRNAPGTVVGAGGEMRVAKRLIDRQVPIEHVAHRDPLTGRKGADILTQDRVIDVKTYDFSDNWLKRSDSFRKNVGIAWVNQAQSLQKRYPGRKAMFIAEGVTTEGIPPELRRAMSTAGIELVGDRSL